MSDRGGKKYRFGFWPLVFLLAAAGGAICCIFDLRMLEGAGAVALALLILVLQSTKLGSWIRISRIVRSERLKKDISFAAFCYASFALLILVFVVLLKHLPKNL